MADDNTQDPIENAGEIIERFGGIRPMASKMDVPVTTVQGWKKRDVIPGNRRDEVIEAAKDNGVNLEGLIKGAANENSFKGEVSAAAASKDPETEARHEKAVLTASRRMDESSSKSTRDLQADNDAMLEQMRAAQSMTFTKSAWFSVGLVVVVLGLSAMLLWPSKQRIDQNSQAIANLKTDVEGVKKNKSFFGNLLPEDLENKFGEIRKQSQQIENSVVALGARVDEIAQDVMEPNITMTERLDRAAIHASELGAPAQLTSMLETVKNMQSSVGGQAQLSAAISKLNQIMGEAQTEEELQASLEQAQQEDDALGFALQGVAQQDLKAAALLLGLAQFRDTMHRSAPFEEDLALMQKMVGDKDPELSAAINKLAPKAASGVLTPDGLKGEFKGLAGDIVVSSLKGEDVSIQEKAKARFNDLVSVEKDGELITGTDTQAKVARAQKMLDEGNIEGAVAELQSLDGQAAQAAEPFINEANMTLLSEQVQGMFANKTVSGLQTGNISSLLGGLDLKSIGGAMTGSMGGAGGMPNAGPELQQLINQVKNMAPQGRVVRDEESGFIILERQPQILP